MKRTPRSRTVPLIIAGAVLAALTTAVVVYVARRPAKTEVRDTDGAGSATATAEGSPATGLAALLAELDRLEKAVEENKPPPPSSWIRVAESLEQLCEGKQGPACYRLGKLWWEGRLGNGDPAVARKYFQAACRLDDAEGCLQYGGLLGRGVGGPADEDEAQRMLAQAKAEFDSACTNGNAEKCELLAQLWENRYGATGETDPEKARQYLEKAQTLRKEACERGSADDCLKAATMLHDGNFTPEESGYLERACSAGLVEGCRTLAWEYVVTRPDRPPDPAKARLYAGKGCDLDDAGSCEALASAYRVQPADLPRALAAADKSCRLGYAEGCRDAGELALAGPAGSVDAVRARHYYTRGCELGEDYYCCPEIARLWRDGVGGPADAAKAREFYHRACTSNGVRGEDQGYGWFCTVLGEMWEKGEGGPKDEAKARLFYHSACESVSDQAGCQAIARMWATGTGGPQDEARAQAYLQRLEGR